MGCSGPVIIFLTGIWVCDIVSLFIILAVFYGYRLGDGQWGCMGCHDVRYSNRIDIRFRVNSRISH
ncbi:hypothetical protein BDV25DRAFT_158452 [Aspergillus avenaceus]|uniref:Transmembrane protein n=1 Tax=Aspergillus avenaceus TaxID=36643 RepID=A0A5N6TQE2_ASPAV|nr:hypothetical protein BDV25DRAFT_158452 [Aspergillus avenaceus]